VRIELSFGALALDGGVSEVARQLGTDPGELAATAGEDYELCACVPPRARAKAEELLAGSDGSGLSWIGVVVGGPPGIAFSDRPTDQAARFPLAGYEHSI